MKTNSSPQGQYEEPLGLYMISSMKRVLEYFESAGSSWSSLITTSENTVAPFRQENAKTPVRVALGCKGLVLDSLICQK